MSNLRHITADLFAAANRLPGPVRTIRLEFFKEDEYGILRPANENRDLPHLLVFENLSANYDSSGSRAMVTHRLIISYLIKANESAEYHLLQLEAEEHVRNMLDLLTKARGSAYKVVSALSQYTYAEYPQLEAGVVFTVNITAPDAHSTCC